jgi:hypothetical protein
METTSEKEFFSDDSMTVSRVIAGWHGWKAVAGRL